ncbi:MAG: hypothetical protein II801_02355 [Bacteroidaceae bacterium]|nr:hypothetical protein [Bacteroidaceae bacterium]
MKQKHFWLAGAMMLAVCAGLTSCGGDDDEELIPTTKNEDPSGGETPTPDPEDPSDGETPTPDPEDPSGGETPSSDSHAYVDLGLPDGTLWATMNVGANSPEEYGDYFAWGETAPKEKYAWSTYKWCNGSGDKLTKYNTRSDYGIVDNLTEPLPEDDAAYVNWGANWRTPSFDQIKVLINGCNWEWSTLGGVYGQKGTSKTNGKTIFFPAAGYIWSMALNRAGEMGYYRSGTYCPSPSGAYGLGFAEGSVDLVADYRCCGWSVRPVISAK